MSFINKENSNNIELQEALELMIKQIDEVGGQFTFDFKVDEEGWVAKCREFDGIVTGGSSKNPSEREIMEALTDSIKTAFHIPINGLEIKNNISLPIISIAREFQLT